MNEPGFGIASQQLSPSTVGSRSMWTLSATHRVASSFDDGASARPATNGNSTRSIRCASSLRPRATLRIAVSIPSRDHNWSSARAPPPVACVDRVEPDRPAAVAFDRGQHGGVVQVAGDRPDQPLQRRVFLQVVGIAPLWPASWERA